MEEAFVLQELEALAGDLGVEVRYDAIERAGGVCRYRGRTWLIVNRALPVPERVLLMAGALARFPLDGVFIRPSVRALLEGRGRSSGATPSTPDPAAARRTA